MALLLLFFAAACTSQESSNDDFSVVAKAPGGKLSVIIFQDANKQLCYQATLDNEVILDTSRIGFSFRDQPDWGNNLTLVSQTESAVDLQWNTLWGEDETIREHYQGKTLTFRENAAPHREIAMEVRVFADGFGFRYALAEQEGTAEITIMDERTEFALTGDHTAWWIPADYDSYEYLYQETPVSEIDTANAQVFNLAARSVKERYAAATPLTMKAESGYYLSIHEAALTNYPGMTLRVEEDKRTLTSSLVPAADGSKATVTLPFTTPWRTVQVGRSPADLMESHLIVNLNEPSKLENTSWIKPSKYMGIWWGHHINKTSWAPGPGQGATTAEAKRYIDFASAHGIPMLLIEGWNKGWDTWGAWPPNPEGFRFAEDAPNFNLSEVVAYGKSKGVGIIAHHETQSSVLNYEAQLEEAFDLLQKEGIHAVKTGYVGPIIPEGEHHHGQWMVNHYRKVVEIAAEHEVMVVAHEPIKPTGLRRTYPNMVAREGVRGSEFNAPWGGGNPPKHLTIVPFTRGLGGPIDYTPGLVMLDLNEWSPGYSVPTTVAYQLAEYVVVYSPVQMASDLPEHYEGEAALGFIEAVSTDWHQSKVLNAEIGHYITVARQERGGSDWFLGSLTNHEGRTLEVSLDFLETGKSYTAHIYKDAADADFQTNNMAYEVATETVTAEDTLSLVLAPGGGQAIWFEQQ